MDIKVEGITHEIMRAALGTSLKKAGFISLTKMLEVCPTFKSQNVHLSPRMKRCRSNLVKIATVIGPGGKQIRAIIEETGVEIDINDDGLISIGLR